MAAGDGELGPPRFVEEVEPEKKSHRFINTMISKEEFEAIGKKGSLRITVDNALDLRIPIPQIDKAFAALRTCEDDLAQRWGMNPADVRSWETPPKPKLAWNKVVNEREWPDWSRDFGKNKASFIVDETGRPNSCFIIESSGSRKLDRALCDAVMRMSFEPARDAQGRPVRSAQMFGVYWTHIWKTRYEFFPR